MDTSKLLEYLSIIIDLEKNKYTQERVIKQLNENISSYTSEYNDNKTINEQVSATIINYDNIPVSEKGKGIMYFMVYYVGALGAGLGALAKSITNSIGISVLVGAVGAVIGGSIPILVWKNIMKNRKQQAMIQMGLGMRADEELAKSRQQRNNEIAVIVPRLKTEAQNLLDTYKLTCETLQKCYAVDIIPVKYRSMVPVCMFYDYILNRRTYSLERNPQTADVGAINMYEDECYRQLIISKFDQLLDKLNEISQNQKVLYNAVQEGNRQTHKLLNDINSNLTNVNKNFQTIQYQNEQRNHCLEYMSYVTYQRYMS